jgi:hypothetical protein
MVTGGLQRLGGCCLFVVVVTFLAGCGTGDSGGTLPSQSEVIAQVPPPPPGEAAEIQHWRDASGTRQPGDSAAAENPRRASENPEPGPGPVPAVENGGLGAEEPQEPKANPARPAENVAEAEAAEPPPAVQEAVAPVVPAAGPLKQANPFPHRVAIPEFPKHLTWLNSRPLTKTDLKGKFVLLDFWTYCCTFCRS